ncbi:MAG: hypothetical protein TR69_WS6001001126 [candidate division WS6 bacterium OLB20]|uniref:Lycopene cyclase domain-containing protein n=1 Tax=candidate division WS6 bacterium OLB20 TaxID=1617426 RepID=A0A136LZL8_9BACT|nr:MAG: hypothetical protein TR69_WS6001001126 [candidate division WS6 bacterium OLB20]
MIELLLLREDRPGLSRRLWMLVLLYLGLSATVFTLFFVDRSLITFNYWQVALVYLAVPFAVIVSRRPRYLNRRLLIPVLFFACVFFSHEILSLHIGHWWWPSDYIFRLSVFGVAIPVEDILIWHLLSTVSLAAGYRFFAVPEK